MPSPIRLTSNHTIDHHARIGIPLTPLDALQQTAAHGEPVESYLEILPKIDAVDAALDQLDARHRWVLEGAFWRGMSMQQLADELGLAKSTIHRLHHTALAEMRELLAHLHGGTTE